MQIRPQLSDPSLALGQIPLPENFRGMTGEGLYGAGVWLGRSRL